MSSENSRLPCSLDLFVFQQSVWCSPGSLFFLSLVGLFFSFYIIALNVMHGFFNVFIFLIIVCIFNSGAFGVVHRCIEKATGRVFVAKFINTPYPLDKYTVKNEINIMNQLHHPKLINLHDAFEDKYEMVLILEL